VDLHERLKYWQRVLRLQDWDIELLQVKSREIGDRWGQTQTSWPWREIRMQIIDADDSGANSSQFGKPFDPEQTLVHELLHTVLDHWQVPPSGIEHDEKEAVLNRLSQTLLNLDRQSQADSYPLHG